MADHGKPAEHAPNPDTDAYAHESEMEAHLQTKRMVINMGPSHPATHGTVRLKVELEGEGQVEADPARAAQVVRNGLTNALRHARTKVTVTIAGRTRALALSRRA